MVELLGFDLYIEMKDKRDLRCWGYVFFLSKGKVYALGRCETCISDKGHTSRGSFSFSLPFVHHESNRSIDSAKYFKHVPMLEYVQEYH